MVEILRFKHGKYPEKLSETLNWFWSSVDFAAAVAIDTGIYSAINAVRPNNIGVGAFKKQVSQRVSSLTKAKGVLSKAGYIMSAAIVIIQVSENVYYDVQSGYSTDRIVSNAVTNTVIYGAATFVSVAGGAKIGALVGTAICPAVGIIVGAAVGAGIGFVADWGLSREIGGKKVIDHARDGVYSGYIYTRDALRDFMYALFD